MINPGGKGYNGAYLDNGDKDPVQNSLLRVLGIFLVQVSGGENSNALIVVLFEHIFFHQLWAEKITDGTTLFAISPEDCFC